VHPWSHEKSLRQCPSAFKAQGFSVSRTMRDKHPRHVLYGGSKVGERRRDGRFSCADRHCPSACPAARSRDRHHAAGPTGRHFRDELRPVVDSDTCGPPVGGGNPIQRRHHISATVICPQVNGRRHPGEVTSDGQHAASEPGRPRPGGLVRVLVAADSVIRRCGGNCASSARQGACQDRNRPCLRAA
jgi:hypothetical protein